MAAFVVSKDTELVCGLYPGNAHTNSGGEALVCETLCVNAGIHLSPLLGRIIGRFLPDHTSQTGHLYCVLALAISD